MRVRQAALLVVLGCVLLTSGCGGDRAGVKPGALATSGKAKPDSDRIVGIAPFKYTSSVPGNVKVSGDDWCEWDTGDGSRYIGATLTHTYTVPGVYYASWTVRLRERVISTGSSEVEVIAASNSACPTKAAIPSMADVGVTARQRLGPGIMASSVGLPSWAGFALVSTSALSTTSVVPVSHGLDTPPLAEADDCIFTFDGDVVYATSKSLGEEVFHVSFGERTARRVEVEAIAYSSLLDMLFVLVYPRGEEEVTGTCYTIRNGTWTIGQLGQPTPVRPYTAGFRMLVNDKTETLLVTVGGMWAGSSLFVLDCGSGSTIAEQSIQGRGFRGLHLDDARQHLWLVDNETVSGKAAVLCVSLDVRGVPEAVTGIGLDCVAVAIDTETGDCYCLVNTGHSMASAKFAVLDEHASLRFIATVDRVACGYVDSLHPDGMRVETCGGQRLLLIAGQKVYAITVQTMQLMKELQLEVDSWVVGHTGDGHAILLYPSTLDLWQLDEQSASIQLLAARPDRLAQYVGGVLDATWDAESGSLCLLSADAFAHWNPSSGEVREVSLGKAVAGAQQAVLAGMGIVASSPDGFAILRLPGQTAARGAVYKADWKRRSLTSLAADLPGDSGVAYSERLGACLWIEGGRLESSSKRLSVALPVNVQWERSGIAVSSEAAIAVVASAQPSGLLATVDLNTGRLTKVAYIGTQQGAVLLALGGDSLWVTDTNSALRVSVSGTAPTACWSLPPSLSPSYGPGFPNRNHVAISSDGETYTVTSGVNGCVYRIGGS
jgi:hypothetical protein